MTDYSRRQFVGALGAGALASAASTRPAAAQTTFVVGMGNNYFDPIGVHVEPGTTVRFEIEAGAHSATAYPDRIPADAVAFDSGTISQGSVEHTFEVPGTYDYYCIPHESVGMVGRIVVDSPGGPAEESPIPYGEVPASETIVDEGAVTGGAAAGDTGRPGGGMMGSGRHGMGSRRDGGAFGAFPPVWVGLGVVGVLAGALYWTLARDTGSAGRDDAAMAALRERYARGELDEAEFQRRRERLTDDESPPE